MIVERENLRKILIHLLDLIELAKAKQDAEVLLVLALCLRRLDVIEAERYEAQDYPGNRFV